MTPEEIAAIIEDHKFPTLHAGETGINVITLQIWLGMLGFYSGPISGLLDPPTAQAVDAFRAAQLAAGIALNAPSGAVLERDTWEAMDNVLQQRLPPDPTTLDRLPFPRRSSYDSEAKYHKALYEGLRAFGFPVRPAAEPLRLPIVTNERGIAILHGLPPGSYTLELGDAGNPALGSADIYLQDGNGAPFSGQIRLVRDGVERAATVASGRVLVDGLEPGDYQVVVDRVDGAKQIIDNTGSIEIRLIDADDLPVAGVATLIGETGDVASVQQAVKLFQALVRRVDRGLDPDDRSGLGSHLLTGEFSETAHDYYERAWNRFARTWGRFYGAPWMGVVFHPLDPQPGHEQQDVNWGQRELIAKLYEWGSAYLQASQNENDLRERLQRPVAVRYIARMLGGRVDQRSDFSQTGAHASLHLPHKTESIVQGVAMGQTYGGIDYDSADYNSTQLETQITAFASPESGFAVQCPDGPLVNRLLPPELQPFENHLVADQYARNRSINCLIKESVTRWRVYWALKRADTKSVVFVVLISSIPELTLEQQTWLQDADAEFYNTEKIRKIYELSTKISSQQNLSKEQRQLRAFYLHVIKTTQKALWWCRFLLRADRLEKVRELSSQLVARGNGGLFTKYTKQDIDQGIANLGFEDTDWTNPWQLEALAELYVNFNDPWDKSKSMPKGTNVPRLPGDDGFIDVSARMSKGLHFVLVDPMGPRLEGTKSSWDEKKGVVTLSVTSGAFPEDAFNKVNQFETIHFPEASIQSPRRTFRITNIDTEARQVTLDATAGEISQAVGGRWQIPAGVGGRVPVRYQAQKKLLKGYDHYDGTLFVMKNGLIQKRFTFTSYTSRTHRGIGQTTSLRGNATYGIWSLMPGSVPINYAFQVDSISSTSTRDGRNYFDPNVATTDADEIFIHNGLTGDRDSGSAGCLVSPAFYDLRACVLGLYPRPTDLKKKELSELDASWKRSHTLKEWDDMWPALDALSNLHPSVRDHINRTVCEADQAQSRKIGNVWNFAIQGTLWLIHPNERPLTRQ